MQLEYDEKKFNIAIDYQDNNDNMLIVFIHGLGCTKDSFKHVFNYPDFKKYSLLSMDMAGFGDSSKSEDFSYSMEHQAELCSVLLDKFPHKSIIIAAHSMGGAIGLLLAEKIQSRLEAFICIEGNLVAEDCGIISRKAIQYSFEYFKGSWFKSMTDSNIASDNYSLRVWGGMLEKCDPLAFYKSSESLVQWSDSNRLLNLFLNLKVRKAYFYGDENSGMELLKRLDGIDKICISGSGHFMMMDNPMEFYNKLFNLI